MGSFNFVKNARGKLQDAVTGQHDKDDQAKEVQEHLSRTGIPDADKVGIQIADDKATVTDDGLNQGTEERILVTVRNISGIASVGDQVKTATPATASRLYTVKPGDTLNVVFKQVYGNANLYGEVFEADKPVLRNPGKVYPG